MVKYLFLMFSPDGRLAAVLAGSGNGLEVWEVDGFFGWVWPAIRAWPSGATRAPWPKGRSLFRRRIP